MTPDEERQAAEDRAASERRIAEANAKTAEILARRPSFPKTLKDVFPSGVARARRDAKKLAKEDNLPD